MSKGWILVGLALAGVGCEDQPNAADTAKDPKQITKKAVEKEMAKAVDGPDCKTFTKEVKQACADHYSKGLDVNCNTLITQVTTAAKQAKGDLFKDPSGKNTNVPEDASRSFCAMMGKRLREQVAASKGTPPGPNCVKMGKVLEEKCFSKIGEASYPPTCNGLVLTTVKWNKDSDKTCEFQAAMMKSLK